MSLHGSLFGDKLQKKPIILGLMFSTESGGKMITGYHGHFQTAQHTHKHGPPPGSIKTVNSSYEVTAIPLLFVWFKRKQDILSVYPLARGEGRGEERRRGVQMGVRPARDNFTV